MITDNKNKWKSYAIRLVECLEAAHEHIDTQKTVINNLKDNEILGSEKPTDSDNENKK